MAFVVVILGGLIFGAADQYLGTLHAINALGWWTVSVSLLSAPWLMLPFCAGWSQQRARRAVVAGLVITVSALAGYFLMTLSPVEGVRFSISGLESLLASNRLNELGGLVAGPLFGWLGYRWRTERSWWAAACVIAALCLEPVVVVAVEGAGDRSVIVWLCEVSTGLLVGWWSMSEIRKARRRVVHPSGDSPPTA